MHLAGSDFIVSATDLASYSGCAQRTWLDRLKALRMAKPDHFGPDARLELLRERGLNIDFDRCSQGRWRVRVLSEDRLRSKDE